MTVDSAKNIQVGRVLDGQFALTIYGTKDASSISCMTPVAGYSQLIVTGGSGGDVHLWDIIAGSYALSYPTSQINMQVCTCGNWRNLSMV